MRSAVDPVHADLIHANSIRAGIMAVLAVGRAGTPVVVHIHDMFIPGEYPERWVLDGWAWNELYVVRAFLAFNSAFRIEVGAHYMLKHHRDLVWEAFPGMEVESHAHPVGGALWIRRTG